MPAYQYYCEENDQTLEVIHSIDVEIHCWGELCYSSQEPLGNTDFMAPVRKVISAPFISVPTGNSKLKETGFTKLVKRDDGVYENVTATGSEKRYMRSDDPSSIPNLKKKISD